ncbi:MAG: FtsX-like permease family protein [Actinomycetes bacterium]
MLLKNVLRTLLQKWTQLVAIGVIVALSSLIYTMMTYGLGAIAEPTTTYLEASDQEDFAVEMLSVVTAEEARYPMMQGAVARRAYSRADIKRSEPATFARLIERRMAAFGDLYPGVTLELREVKILDFEIGGRAHTALVARDADRINLSFMEQGAKPTRDSEVAVNRIYAEKNGIRVGGSIMLKDRLYRVTGFVLFPDYTLTTFDDSFNIDTGLQPLVLMTDGAYQSVDAEESFRLAGVSDRDTAIDTAYDEDQLPFVTQIVPTSTNMRSGAIYDEIEQGRAMSLGLGVFIASIAVIIVAIMMSNLLSAERGQIGILKAMGYRRIEIAVPYFTCVVAWAFLMLMVGYGAGAALAEPLKMMYLDFYLLPRVEIAQTPTVFATAIFVPLLFFALFSGVVIRRMLGERPLALLKPHEATSLNLLTRYVARLLRGARGRTKFTFLHAVRNTGSFLVFFVGIMFSTLLITFAFTMDGMVDRMTVGSLDRVAYQYQAYVDPQERTPEPQPGEERFLVYPYGYVEDDVVSLQGLAADNALYHLYDAEGADVTGQIRRGAVITESLSRKLDVGVGDRLGVRVNATRHDFRITGVADEFADQVYVEIEALSTILSEGESTRMFSGVYALERPSPLYYGAIISKQGLLEQSRSMATYTSYMVNVMVGASAVIAASILFILTAFAVERNYYSISLLKVLGYSRREVNGMVLNSYFVYSLISYALSVPIALASLALLQEAILAEYGFVMPLSYDPADTVKGLAVLVAIFLAGTFVSRRKIAGIPLQEVFKTYGE